jgi:hypothetical protein
MKISNSFEKIERKIFNTNFKTTLASKYKMIICARAHTQS